MKKAIEIGDRVRMARHPFLKGTVEGLELGLAHVRWDDDDPEDLAFSNIVFDPEHSLVRLRQQSAYS
jgi:hypothetical protein